MKCIADAASSAIIRVSDVEANWLVRQKPHRYSYVSKRAYKAEQAYLKAAKDRPSTLKVEVRKSRKGRARHGNVS